MFFNSICASKQLLRPLIMFLHKIRCIYWGTKTNTSIYIKFFCPSFDVTIQTNYELRENFEIHLRQSTVAISNLKAEIHKKFYFFACFYEHYVWGQKRIKPKTTWVGERRIKCIRRHARSNRGKFEMPKFEPCRLHVQILDVQTIAIEGLFLGTF